MDTTPTGSILIHLVDGTRQALPSSVKWLATMHDGHSPSEWKMIKVRGTGSALLIKGLTFFDNFFDNYTVIVNAKGYDDAGWMPIQISPAKPAAVNLICKCFKVISLTLIIRSGNNSW